METEKKNKRTTAYLVMFMAFALVVLGVSAYAFYVNDITFGDELPSNVMVPKASVFTSTSEGEILFNGTPKDIGQYSVSTNAVLNSTANVNVKLLSGTDYETTYCRYDLVWTYSSDEMYKESDVDLPYTAADGTEYKYEFSGMVNGKYETDLSGYIWDEKKTILLGNLVIGSARSTEGEESKHDHTFLFQMYNIDAEQTNLFDRTFAANIELLNQECFTEEYNSGAHRYFLYDKATFSYVEQSTAPTIDNGVSPILDTALTHCAKGGTVSNYNASTGTLTLPSDDECYIYFTEYSG